MKWYKITLTSYELTQKLDQKIIKNFVQFMVKQGSPPGLAMHTYSSEYLSTEKMIYYFSSPDEYSIVLNNFLSEFQLAEVPEPKLNSLTTILGTL